MVVLEGGGMLSTAANQYLQPDYLSPLPATVSWKSLILFIHTYTCLSPESVAKIQFLLTA